jgi:hypothetical protein
VAAAKVTGAEEEAHRFIVTSRRTVPPGKDTLGVDNRKGPLDVAETRR